MHKRKILIITILSILTFIIIYKLCNKEDVIKNDDIINYDLIKKENEKKEEEKRLLKEKEENLISNYITDDSEIDNNVVKEYYANSIDVEIFKSILLQKESLLQKEGLYKSIEYNFDNKLHYSEIENIINKLNCSKIVNVDIIGHSADNRKMYGVEIGKGNKVLFLDANIHAAEVANTYMLLKFAIDIVNSYEENDENIINILNNIKIAIIFVNNPDGYGI